MSLREDLEKKKAKLLKKLEPFYRIKQELEEVESALAALPGGGPKCGAWCPGCSDCRRGMEFR